MLPDTCFLCGLETQRSTVIRLAGPIAGQQQTICLHPACTVRLATRILTTFDAHLPLDADTSRRISDHAPLTSRERQVLAGIVNSQTNAEIAHHLGLSAKTVKNYTAFVYQKLHVNDRTQAAIYALNHNLTESASSKHG